MYYSDFVKKLELAGIPHDKARTFDVLILPENVADCSKHEDLFEAAGTANLAKLLVAAGCRCATAYTFGLNVPGLERRASDKWLGCIWIRDTLAIPLIIGTISSLVASHISDASKTSEPPPPPPVVHARIVIGDSDGGFATFDYDGNGDTLIKMLEAAAHVRGIQNKAQ